MAFTDKLKFWKKEEPLEPLKPLGGEHGLGEEIGKEPSTFEKEPGFGGSEEAGFGKDMALGLGGTSELGRVGAGTPAESAMGHKPEKDVSLYGPSYEKPPEAGDLRHAPLAPMERAIAPAVSAAVPKDIEIMSAKIDAIKANIESINHRLESIERILMTQEKKRVQW